MSISKNSNLTMAKLVRPQTGNSSADNPYATPETLVVANRQAKPRLGNFELFRLGYTLRAHGILTAIVVALMVAAYIVLVGYSYQLGSLMFLGAMLLAVILGMLTVMLLFFELPFLVAIIAIAFMFIPAIWPIHFVAVHWWGRRILQQHSMGLGVFSRPRYVAALAEETE